MALQTNGGTDGSNHGSPADVDNLAAATFLLWIYPDFNGDYQGFIGKLNSSGNLGFWFHFLGGFLTLGHHRATTALEVRSSTTTITTGKWWFIAGTYNSAGAAGDQEIYVGDLTTPAAEEGYSLQQLGTGGLTDDSSVDMILGGLESTGGFGGFGGRMAQAAMWNRQLTAAEIQQQQYRMFPSNGCIRLWYPGENGTTSVLDRSGTGAAGTITGTPTVGDNPPLRFWTPRHGKFPAAAAPAGDAVPQAWAQYRRRAG